MRAAAPDWAGCSTTSPRPGLRASTTCRLELGLKPKELKAIRSPLERCGAIVARSLQVTAGRGARPLERALALGSGLFGRW